MAQASASVAATTWSEIAAANLPPAFDALRQAAREVGSIQIQNRGTIAGNLCNASPAADGVPPLLALDAAVELASANGTRQLPLSEFITGYRRTARQPDEILSAVIVPPCCRPFGLRQAGRAALPGDLHRDGRGLRGDGTGWVDRFGARCHRRRLAGGATPAAA